ncbi:toll-like receptor 4 [Phascolarctos cinereus]|uniref:Toll-like receptor 4 n=2 Tax=Phascolarctos cinereus TaxID=38626 RepID=A0A6P5KKU5_PHACI|nr:toll-like receptor 4 [Phascolarctos cinereus]
MVPWTAVALITATTFFSCLDTGSCHSCLEVFPSIEYQCTDRNFSEVPMDIPSSTQNLDLSFNPLRSLAPRSFSRITGLIILDLSRCDIQKIEDDTYQGLYNLSTLILTGNPIQSLGLRAFYGLPKLQKLVVVETNLVSLEDFPIGHLVTLQELYLGHNFISSLQLPSYFASFSSLQHLDLHLNQIKNISDGDLEPIKLNSNLTLDLSQNPIQYIQPGILKGIHLSGLILRGSFHSSTIMDACLKGMTGLQVDKLVLGDYKNEIRLGSFESNTLDGLCEVDISEFWMVAPSEFPSDSNGFFKCLVNISIFHLVMAPIEELTNLPTFPKLFSLVLTECNFDILPILPSTSLPSLKELRITRHKDLTTLSNLELPNLELLDLSQNSLTVLSCCSDNTFGTTKLKYLNLSYNAHIKFSKNFMGLENLESLDLQHCKLKDQNNLPLFFSLTNLQYLDISYTDTHVKSKHMFTGLSNLRHLKMAGNSFQDNILHDIFKNLSELVSLNISYCHLERVLQEAMESLHQLQVLDISHNNLQTFDPLICMPLWNLQVLNCSFNSLTALDGQNLEALPGTLVSIDLSGNPFDCVCDHQIFFQWVKEHIHLLNRSNPMTCQNPSHMKDVSVLLFDNITCQMKNTIIAMSVLGIMVVILVLALVYKFYFHLMLLVGCKKIGGGESTYDAFVIYSSQDEEWVRKELVKNLEEGVPSFQLCLHYRDFIPGVAIAANIIQEGFHKSRKVIVVISKHFIQSRWCKFEYEIAQTWQFLSSQAGIIFIMLQKVEKSLLRQQVELYRLLRRNTYLEWEDTSLGRHVFWRRLRKALLDGRTKSHNKVAEQGTR